jgi:predicted adenine nucleotide alpha hydrolase (AANH) superfamily ATPase/very-short-patch-repair endonuclease
MKSAIRNLKLALMSCCAPCSAGAIRQLQNLISSAPEREFPSVGGVPRSGGVVPAASRNSIAYHSLPFNAKLKELAKKNRKGYSLPEALLWKEIKNKQLNGLDFDRQKIIGNYIVDFFCPNNRVVIEIDDKTHDCKIEYDAKRDEFLKSFNLEIIHIPASAVLKNPHDVFEILINHPACFAGTPPTEGNLGSGGVNKITDFVVLFYNPNIFPESEYQKRLDEQIKYCESLGVKYEVLEYNHDDWLAAVHGLESEPERGRRCEACFRFRFSRGIQWAQKNGYNAITSVFGASKHKSQEQVDTCANDEITLQNDGVDYIPIAWDESLRQEINQKADFYRQNYCGCEFSVRK